MPTNDEALVRQTIAGSAAAFHQLYCLYKDRVFATAYRIVGNFEEAIDVTQDVFVKVFHDLDSFKFESKFSTWLYRVAVNFSINRVNETDRHGRIESQLAYERSPDRFVESDPPNERIQAAIQRLSTKLRAVVVLRYLQDLSYDEIAQVLDLSIGTVKSRLHLAHEALREELSDLLG